MGNCHIKSSHFRDATATHPLNNQAYSVRGDPKKFIILFSLQGSLLSFDCFGFQKGLGLQAEGLWWITKTSCLRARACWDQHWLWSWAWSPRELQLETQDQGSSYSNLKLNIPSVWDKGAACSPPVPKLQIRDCPGRNLMYIYVAHNQKQLQVLWST